MPVSITAAYFWVRTSQEAALRTCRMESILPSTPLELQKLALAVVFCALRTTALPDTIACKALRPQICGVDFSTSTEGHCSIASSFKESLRNSCRSFLRRIWLKPDLLKTYSYNTWCSLPPMPGLCSQYRVRQHLNSQNVIYVTPAKFPQQLLAMLMTIAPVRYVRRV